MRTIDLAAAFALSVALTACSAASDGQTFNGGSGGSGASGGAGGAGGGVQFDSGIDPDAGGGGGGGSGCIEAAKLVYVLSSSNEIWSFAPAAKQFTKVMSLSCATPNDGNTWAPNSMAVDRNAVAWVNYVGSDAFLGSDAAGLIFRVDIQNKTCEPAPAVQLPNKKWFRLGMGFSTDTAGGSAETLYVTGTASGLGGGNSPGLGHIDMASKALVTTPGQFSGDGALTGQSAELTGTGDAKLFGFFTTSPVRVAQIDTGSAAILSDDTVQGVQTPQAWAFSFWGGAFYLYTSDGFSPSKVTRFDPATHAVDGAYQLSAPAVLVGAGVSTCAPLTQPK